MPARPLSAGACETSGSILSAFNSVMMDGEPDMIRHSSSSHQPCTLQLTPLSLSLSLSLSQINFESKSHTYYIFINSFSHTSIEYGILLLLFYQVNGNGYTFRQRFFFAKGNYNDIIVNRRNPTIQTFCFVLPFHILEYVHPAASRRMAEKMTKNKIPKKDTYEHSLSTHAPLTTATTNTQLPLTRMLFNVRIA